MNACQDTDAAAVLRHARRLHAQGDFQAALAAYRGLLAAAPNDARVLNLCGALHYQLGEHHDAVALLSAALARAPALAGAWQNLVLPLLALDRVEDACHAGAQAVAAAPHAAGCHHNLTLALSRAGRRDEAAAAAETMIALEPESASGWVLLADLRAAEGHHHQAAALFRRALACDPDHREAQCGLGAALHKRGDYAGAEAAWRAVLARDPHHHTALVNLGVILRDQGRWQDAAAVWNNGLAALPHSVELRFNLACAELHQGNWHQGWQDYEARWPARGQTPPFAGTKPWGGEHLPAATLLIHHEQGLGDTIQFLRFVALALDRVGAIVLVCPPRLVRLLSSWRLFRPARDGSPPRARLVADTGVLPAADAAIALMSLPAVLGITPQTLPRAAPYLFAEPARIEAWAARLTENTAPARPQPLRVGLVWQGNPEAPCDRGRSLPLAALAPLAAVEGARFFALQKGFGREQIACAPIALDDLGDALDRDGDGFVDTAAVLAGLDLLITSDTAIAHLAGALGRPVWVILKAGCDWRWGDGTALTPWCPTMRLFRQHHAGDWTAVVATVAAELGALIAARAHLHAAPPPALPLDRAIAFHQDGRFAEAAQLYRGHLRALSDQPHLLNRLAMALCEACGWSRPAIEAALVLALRAAALAPLAAEVHSNLGVLLKRLGRALDAEIAFSNALAIAPGQPAALQNLVNLLNARGRAAEAVTIAEQAATVADAAPSVLAILGDALAAAGRLPDAEAAYRRAIARAPDQPRHWVTLGKLLSADGRWDAAGECWERALELAPDDVDALNNLGVLERNNGDIALAQWFYRRALAIRPHQPNAWCNLGIARHDQGDCAAARDAFATAVGLDPAYADAHMALGMTLLLEGDYAAGLPAYEWRLNSSVFGTPPSRLPMPAWDGGTIAGKRLLLLAEQGFGDAIMFVRYAGVLKARGAAAVTIGCRTPLARLLARAAGVDAVVREGEPVPAADAYAHLMSLPRLVGTRLDSIPAATPYLSAEPERVLHWAGRLAAGIGLRVGLVWQGSPDLRVDRGRSLPLAAFAPLSAIAGVRLIALQKGAGAEQREQLAATMAVEGLGADFDDGGDAFIDTAAVMMNLDLVITTDTAVAHLAGALGRPCWVLLKATPEWRWLRERADSPWYPSLRLFRQQPDADPAAALAWAPVVERIGDALRRLVNGDRAVLVPTTAGTATSRAAAGATPIATGQVLQAAQRLHREGDAAGAARLYARVLAAEPDNGAALDGAGTAALQLGRHRRAALLLARARAVGVRTPELLSNLAVARKAAGDFAEAEGLLREAIALAPAFAEARLNLGNLLRETGRAAEAVAVLRAALARLKGEGSGRSSGRCLRTLGNALRDTGAIKPAIAMLRRAVAAAPEDAEAHIDLAHALLAAGDYTAGFAEYAWRWRGREMRPRALAAPAWNGSRFDGRTLLVHGEQGLGDHIQFARLLAAAAGRGGSVVFACRPALCRLMAGLSPMPPALRVVADGEALPAHDLQIPLLSLAHVLDIRLANVPAAVPYLRAEPERVRQWSGLLAGAEHLRVGLAWQGNPQARADRGRSLPLAVLEPILAVAGVRFIALQKEHGLEGLAALAARYPIGRPAAPFDAGDDTFLDTAAILEGLDLVITTDTAVAHLAGALGRPTWLLLKSAPDWRWLLDRTDSPWYPTMRLFRQPRPGDWAAAVAMVAQALRAAVAARSGSE